MLPPHELLRCSCWDGPSWLSFRPTCMWPSHGKLGARWVRSWATCPWASPACLASSAASIWAGQLGLHNSYCNDLGILCSWFPWASCPRAAMATQAACFYASAWAAATAVVLAKRCSAIALMAVCSGGYRSCSVFRFTMWVKALIRGSRFWNFLLLYPFFID